MMRKSRGAALIIALFFVMLMFLMCLGYIRLVPQELRHALQEQNRTQGELVCQSAADSWLAWLEDSEQASRLQSLLALNVTAADWNSSLSLPATSSRLSRVDQGVAAPWRCRYDLTANRALAPGQVDTILLPTGQPDSRWSTNCTLFADRDCLLGLTPRSFRMQVSAFLYSRPIYSAEFLVQQSTFAKYGFFVDHLPNGGFYAAFNTDRYEGEFHVNSRMPIYVGDNLFTAFMAPVFQGVLSFTQSVSNAAGDNLDYQTSTRPFDAAGQEIVDRDGLGRYSKLMKLGRTAIQLGPEVPMPRTNPNQQLPLARAAWFGRNSPLDDLSTQSIPAGATLRVENGLLTGVYIRDDLRQMGLQVVTDTDGRALQSVARNSQGVIDHGNPALVLQEEVTVSTHPSARTTITELRDSNINFNIPAGSLVRGVGVVSAPYPVAIGRTVVRRDPGTAQGNNSVPVYEIYDGFGNGVVYVDGNLGKVDKLDAQQANPGYPVDRDTFTTTPATSQGGLSGINYGSRKTIGVNVATNKYLRIQGDITRGDTRPGDAPVVQGDGIGVVGYDIVLGEENFARPSMVLYSLVMAGRRDATTNVVQPGSVLYENYASHASRVLYSFGSYVVGNDRYWGSLSSGWKPTFRHDTVLANSPTPFYPTRDSYQILHYKAGP